MLNHAGTLIAFQSNNLMQDSNGSGEQWIDVSFTAPTLISSISLQFQGGFSAGQVQLVPRHSPESSNNNELKQEFVWHPQDNNALQVFALTRPVHVVGCRLVLAQPTDFFSRMTVYRLDMS